MFTMIVGRFEIVATSGVKNGSVRVGKSEALAYDVIDRRQRGSIKPEKVGVDFDDAWSTASAIRRVRKALRYCINQIS